MGPALRDGELVVSWKRARNPEIGEIILFKHGDLIYSKRVVALGEDEVEAKNGVLLVNGKKAPEKYLKKKGELEDFGPVKVPENSVFVLGDDRKESVDSREMGPISLSDIRGVLIKE